MIYAYRKIGAALGLKFRLQFLNKQDKLWFEIYVDP